jgi:hypothetical protein
MPRKATSTGPADQQPAKLIRTSPPGQARPPGAEQKVDRRVQHPGQPGPQRQRTLLVFDHRKSHHAHVSGAPGCSYFVDTEVSGDDRHTSKLEWNGPRQAPENVWGVHAGWSLESRRNEAIARRASEEPNWTRPVPHFKNMRSPHELGPLRAIPPLRSPGCSDQRDGSCGLGCAERSLTRSRHATCSPARHTSAES